jgi:hypothetical protein
VAVKCAKGASVEDVRGFLKARITRPLPKHENVWPLLGASLDGDVCLVTPFCQRGCLADRIDSLSWFHRLLAARGFFRGLKELHKAGVTHGAVKPGNVFVFKNDKENGELDAAVGDVDFLGVSLHAALAKLKPDDATRNYYAPEVLGGDTCTFESDVYGAGVVLLELLTSNEGRVPVPGEVANGATKSPSGAESSGGGDAESAGGAAALLSAAVAAGWPAETAKEVIALAAACVRPNPERRKTSLLVAKALETVISDCVARAGGLEKLRGNVSAAEARARGIVEKLENFAAAKPRRRREAEAAAIKMQAAYRGRIARRRVLALKEGGDANATRLGLLDAEQEAVLAERFASAGDAEYAAAVMIQKSYRGKLARREIMARLDADAAAAAESERDVLGRFGAAVSTSGRPSALSPKQASARDAAFAQVFARIASMLADHDGAVQAAAAAALSVYVDPEEGPESRAAAEAAVRAGVLGPLVGVFCSKNARALEDAAACLETITIEFPSEQNRALRAGALEGALRLMVTGNPKDPKALASRAAGARALKGLLLQNPPACRRAMEKGGLDVLISVMDTEDAACCAAASSALSALADADSDILQKLGVERLVSMAVRAETPPMRAATITFVSKLARDSDTHEQIIEAGGLELLLGMILRLNEEAVWGLASMASVEDNWDAIEEVFDDEGVESVRDLLEMAGDYGKEGAAWAVCYMSGHPSLQVKLVRGNLLPPLIEMVKHGTRRCKKAAERALKAMAM